METPTVTEILGCESNRISGELIPLNDVVFESSDYSL